MAPTVLDYLGLEQPPEMDGIGRRPARMSISKRLIDLARAELNSLLDRAAARRAMDDDAARISAVA